MSLYVTCFVLCFPLAAIYVSVSICQVILTSSVKGQGQGQGHIVSQPAYCMSSIICYL